MISDLANFLFNEKILPKKDVYVIGSTDVDSGFITQHFITAFIKGNGNVVLLSFVQTFNHYKTIAAKLGVNLTACKEEGRLIFIDGLALINDAFIQCMKENNADKDPEAKSKPFVWSSDRCCLKGLHHLLTDGIDKVNSNSTVLIVDGLHGLTCMGISNDDLMNFVHYQTSRIEQSTEKPLALVLVSNCPRSNLRNHSDAKRLFNSCCHVASHVLNLTGLQTGYSRDVDGEITLMTFDNIDSSISSKSMHYKLSDKVIRLFPRGTSSAVL